MKLDSVSIRNFRRLENVQIDIEDRETLFVGPNNSGKTSATAIFRCFLGGREFRIHDFSVSRMSNFDAFSAGGDESELPEIQMDLWFVVDPNSVAYGRVFTLLPNLEDFERLGFRLSLGFADAGKLRADYNAAYPPAEDGSRARSLFQYLAMDTNFARHSIVRFASLERRLEADGSESVQAVAIEPEEGKRLLKQLVRVEFVDAQRNINDDDSSRSNRLSSAFAAFYRKNLQDVGPAVTCPPVVPRS